MAQVGHVPVTPGDLNLLRKELEAQGEFITNENLERKIEVDKLKISIEALKRAMEQVSPGFIQEYETIHRQLLRTFDPEGKSAGL